jgi:hypothetical protein
MLCSLTVPASPGAVLDADQGQIYAARWPQFAFAQEQINTDPGRILDHL